MEPVRPSSREKSSECPQSTTCQQHNSGLSNLSPQEINGPRPITFHTIPSSQPLPVAGLMPCQFRAMRPRATGVPQQRFPRLLGPRPGISGVNIPRSRMSGDNIALNQDPLAGVRIYLKLYIIYIHIYVIFFFKVQQIREGFKNMGTGNEYFI